MNFMNQKKPRLLNQEGQALTEYMTILILVSVFCILSVKSVGTTLKSKIKYARKQINSGISVNSKLTEENDEADEP